jgi:plasmid maintenance system antidote protein VapI
MEANMINTKQARLKAKGWKIGSVTEFLGLTPGESAYVELKIALGDLLQAKRKENDLTQTGLAEHIHSSQSRVAKMEKADPSVSLDLVVRSLYALGTENAELGAIIAESTPEYATSKTAKEKKKTRRKT